MEDKICLFVVANNSKLREDASSLEDGTETPMILTNWRNSLGVYFETQRKKDWMSSKRRHDLCEIKKTGMI